ncbi:MAG: hypothetical protein JSS86_22845, partial [Cyanobacteria bacterium SZAS LIN-2]|nr:hypothetical protein [Cyanobacteria bacterium SZAS LIN-2]
MLNNFERLSAQSQPIGSARKRIAGIVLGLAWSFSLTSAEAIANAPVHTPFSSASANPPASGVWAAHSGQAFTQSHFQHSSSHGLHNFQAPSVLDSQTQNTQGGVHHALNFFHHHSHVLQGSNLQPGASDLNLSSSQQKFLAGNLANFSALTIDVGGRQELVSLNTMLTPAELVAAQQVLTGGSQTIKLNASGAAVGGTIALNNTLLNAIDHSVGGINTLTIA